MRNGQNHVVNLRISYKPLARESERRFGSAQLGFMILSYHDSVIYYSCWRRSNLPYAN